MDSRYVEEKRVLVPVDVDREDLVTLSQAAKMLGVSVQAVAGRISRGKFAVIIDLEAGLRRRRRLLRRVDVLERMWEM